MKINIELYDNDSPEYMNFVSQFGEDVVSTEDEIKVVDIGTETKVIYTTNTFMKLDPPSTLINLNRILHENVADEIFAIDFISHSNEDCVEDHRYEFIEALNAMDSDDFYLIGVIKPYKEYDEEEEPELNFDEVEYDDDDENEDEEVTPFNVFDQPHKKSTNLYVRRSSIFSSSKNPKKQVNRHGILVATKSRHIEKDREMIKAFLKKFIPGKSPWVKRYRNKVLKRWISMYVVDKKTIHKFEKQYQSKRRKKKTDKLITLGKKLIHTSDPWNDPNK
nr:MAG TPA: hypothetical protein [Caudoviricetes sp.]